MPEIRLTYSLLRSYMDSTTVFLTRHELDPGFVPDP